MKYEERHKDYSETSDGEDNAACIFVMNFFQSPNQKKGGLNAHDAMNGPRNSVQTLTRWMRISRTSAISVTD
jgi:hypothetical protein